MNNKPEPTPGERDKREIKPDFDFRKLIGIPLDQIPPAEMSRFKWSGIYPQSQPGFFMVRLVLPGGRMNRTQFARAVDLAESYARGSLQITTRQDLQFHWVEKDHLYRILEGMAEVGVTTRNGCGDVPRNIVGAPLAGMPPSGSDAERAAHFIQTLATDPEIQNQRDLPRKHKISVAFANTADAQTLINCQGWVPVNRTDSAGWRFHAGGGLGARPCLAQVVFDWVPEELALAVARATVEAFRRHGNRENRAFARLKVVVEKIGADAFGDLLLEILRERGIPGLEKIEKAASPVPAIGESRMNGQETVPQPAGGSTAVRILIPQAELKTAPSRTLIRLMHEFGGGPIVFTNRQNLELHGVPEQQVQPLLEALHAAGFRTSGLEHLPDIVVCVGSSLCRMATTDTLALHHHLYAALTADEAYWKTIGPLRIHITGCPNNCAHAWVADIGLRGKRLRNGNGGSEEGWTVYLGGKLSGAGRIAEALCDLSSAEIIPALHRILALYLKNRHNPEERFDTFCERVGIEPFKKQTVL